MIFSNLELRRCRPQQLLCLGPRLDCVNIVTRKELRLQFSDPIPAPRDRRPRVRLQLTLESVFVKIRLVEGRQIGG